MKDDDIHPAFQGIIQNGLADVMSGLMSGMPFFSPAAMGTQISQLDTALNNNRWQLLSNNRQLLNELYAEHGLIQVLVDVPVDDGLRGGVDILTEQLDPDEISELQNDLDNEDILTSAIGQSMKWNRLFGGAGTVIITDQDPLTPLNIDAINEDTPLAFKACDMWELFYDKQNMEGYNNSLDDNDYEYYSYYGKQIHKSRVMKLKGITPPSFIRPRLRGWGLSVVEAIVKPFNQFLKTNELVFEVLDEFKLDIYRMKGFNTTLATKNGSTKIMERIQLANQQKNFQNAVVLDAEDDYASKELSFAGISDVSQSNRMQIASELRMPLTKIFGISSAGFSSGQDDIENYNAMIESQIRSKAKHLIASVVKIKCKQKFGIIPSDLKIGFKPLRVLSAEQEENVKTQQFNRLLQALEKGEITPLEFRESVNKNNLLPIQLSTDEASLPTRSAQEEEGANKPETQKSQVTTKTSAPKSKLEAKEATT